MLCSFRSARNYLPTASFRTRPRFEEHARRSREGGMQSYEFVNDKGPWISSTKRELKFPMKVRVKHELLTAGCTMVVVGVF